ncbi:hypothetical protein C8Q79DRAFT_976539 [Trametes meyenii]|nr:hypothetical protein C8Q79DRAFT_976539 [Trametes meyenii]
MVHDSSVGFCTIIGQPAENPDSHGLKCNAYDWLRRPPGWDYHRQAQNGASRLNASANLDEFVEWFRPSSLASVVVFCANAPVLDQLKSCYWEISADSITSTAPTYL